MLTPIPSITYGSLGLAATGAGSIWDPSRAYRTIHYGVLLGGDSREARVAVDGHFRVGGARDSRKRVDVPTVDRDANVRLQEGVPDLLVRAKMEVSRFQDLRH